MNLPPEILSHIVELATGEDFRKARVAGILARVSKQMATYARPMLVHYIWLSGHRAAHGAIAFFEKYPEVAVHTRSMMYRVRGEANAWGVKWPPAVFAPLLRQCTSLQALALFIHGPQLDEWHSITREIAGCRLRELDLEILEKGGAIPLIDGLKAYEIVEPHLETVTELRLTYRHDAAFAWPRHPARLQVLSAYGLAVDVIAGIVNHSPKLYSLSLSRADSVFKLIDKARKQALIIVILEMFFEDLNEMDFSADTFKDFTCLYRLFVRAAALDEDTLRGIPNSCEDLAMDWNFEMDIWLELLDDGDWLPYLETFALRAEPWQREGWEDGDFQDALADLKQMATDRGVAFTFDISGDL